MKIGRQYVGKYVEFVWRDPIGGTRVDKDKALRGLAALSAWRERGVIDDITEGVVRIAHSEASGPGGETDEGMYSWVPETLITEITVYSASNTEKEGG